MFVRRIIFADACVHKMETFFCTSACEIDYAHRSFVYRDLKKKLHRCNNSLSSQQACKVCHLQFSFPHVFHLAETSLGSWVGNLFAGHTIHVFILFATSTVKTKKKSGTR
jgi:hypothetical protein